MKDRPNVLFVMTDQQRFDTIAALGNRHIFTPNLDRLVSHGVSFTNAYSTCPVCVPARYTIRTGCEPPATRVFSNRISGPAPGQADTIEGRCGPYLAKVMRQLGYRTFGIGKFHSSPRREPLGYDVHLHSEELHASPEERATDAYAAWLAREHPEYGHLEQLMGERTEMYYMPQTSAQPADCAAGGVGRRPRGRADRRRRRPALVRIRVVLRSAPSPRPADPVQPHVRPGPHARSRARRPRHRPHGPADPAYESPDLGGGTSTTRTRASSRRATTARSPTSTTAWAGSSTRSMHAEDADDTLICFFSDHGDHLGDHHAWQKESFFEASAHVPFLVSWPARLSAGRRCAELVCLTDLFGIATAAAGHAQLRDGIDVLGVLDGSAPPRDSLVGWYGLPGTAECKVMVRDRRWEVRPFRQRRPRAALRPGRGSGRAPQPCRLARQDGGRVARDGRRRVPPPRRARRPGGRRPQGAAVRAVGVAGRADLPVRPVAGHHRLPRAPRGCPSRPGMSRSGPSRPPSTVDDRGSPTRRRASPARWSRRRARRRCPSGPIRS